MTSTILIYFDNKPIGLFRTNRIIELGIAVVPEGRRLFPKMTVLENLKLGAYFVRDQKYTAERLDRVFSLFPVLETRINQTAGTP